MGEKTTEKKKSGVEEAEEIREILGAVSTEVPALIKSIIASVFSEETGRSMGKAAAAFHNELKDSGMPDDVAVKMTEDYIGVFTSLGDVLKKAGGGGKLPLVVSTAKPRESEKDMGRRVTEEELEKEIEKRVKQRLSEKRREEDEDE